MINFVAKIFQKLTKQVTLNERTDMKREGHQQPKTLIIKNNNSNDDDNQCDKIGLFQ